jgi:hypothetical protein
MGIWERGQAELVYVLDEPRYYTLQICKAIVAGMDWTVNTLKTLNA